MPARKAAKKGAKKAARKAGGARKATLKLTATQVIAAVLKKREWVLYGIPIRDLTAVGNLADLRRVSVAARTHLEDVQSSINKLDAAIRTKTLK